MDNTLNIAVCEDEPDDAAALIGMIKKTGVASVCQSFQSGEEFLASFCAWKYDLVFMDIYMTGMRGIETVEAIRRADENVIIAFVTTSPDFMRESYRLDALKYIEKPVTEKAVASALELAVMKQKSRASIVLTAAGGESINLMLDTVSYFEQRQHVIEIHTASGVLRTSQSAKMNGLEKLLPNPPFLRCHRSYIVNLDYVLQASMESYAFMMKNGDRVDIKRGRFTECKTAYQKWLLGKMGRNGE